MAGFYSKDLILESFLEGGFSSLMFFLLSFGTLLTAFYATRFVFLMCRGEESLSWTSYPRGSFSLVAGSSILGVGAIFGGFIIQQLILDVNSFIYLRVFQKSRILCSVLLGVFISLVYF